MMKVTMVGANRTSDFYVQSGGAFYGLLDVSLCDKVNIKKQF